MSRFTFLEREWAAVFEAASNRSNGVEMHISNMDVAHRRLAETGRQMHPIIESSWGEASFRVLAPDWNLLEIIGRKRPSKESTWRR